MSEPFIGVQLGAHSVFDEGADHVLDTLQSTAGVNAVFVYSHTYHGFATGRHLSDLADHGVALRDPKSRELTSVWVPPNERYYGGTILRHNLDPALEYAGADVLAELIEPAKARDMQVFVRILEGAHAHLPREMDNWTKVMSVDVYNRLYMRTCWNNPDYKAWVLSTIEDLFKTYPIAGLKYGTERSGPLSHLLFYALMEFKKEVPMGTTPHCFCEHCQNRALREGIRIDRAREGFVQLHKLVNRQLRGDSHRDGALVSILRILLRFPEVMAWELMQHESKEDLARLIYGAAKHINPAAKIGWHVWQGMTWDPIYRAEMDYERMVEYSDWLKPVVYHDAAGPRTKGWMMEKMERTVFGDTDHDTALAFLLDMMGYDRTKEPSYSQLENRGFSSDYVFRETKRCVEGVGDQIPVYPGIGFDVPTANPEFRSSPDAAADAMSKAIEAGARGVILSREYDEMRLENLKAVGKAIRQAWSDRAAD